MYRPEVNQFKSFAKEMNKTDNHLISKIVTGCRKEKGLRVLYLTLMMLPLTAHTVILKHVRLQHRNKLWLENQPKVTIYLRKELLKIIYC